MKEYELLYIVSGGLSEAEATKVTDDVGNALAKLGGKAQESDDGFWGRRRLAYEIGKDDHGWYVVTRFSIDPAKLDELQKTLNLNGKIIRTVLVNAAEVPTAEEAAKAKEAAEQAESDKKDEAPAKAKAATEDTVPEEIKKTVKPVSSVAERKASPKPEAEETPTAEPKQADDKERQAKLDEKLGEILKD